MNASITDRAAATNPVAATRAPELTEIRATQVTVAGVAAGEIREALSEYQLEGVSKALASKTTDVVSAAVEKRAAGVIDGLP